MFEDDPPEPSVVYENVKKTLAFYYIWNDTYQGQVEDKSLSAFYHIFVSYIHTNTVAHIHPFVAVT